MDNKLHTNLGTKRANFKIRSFLTTIVPVQATLEADPSAILTM